MEYLTTKEQSDKLLSHGVDKNRADFYYGKNSDKILHIDGSIPYSLLWRSGCIPCWSVGKLIELYRSIPDAKQTTFVNLAYTDDITELLVENICSLIQSNKKKEEVCKKCEIEKIQTRKKRPNKMNRDIEVLSLSSKMFGEMIVDDFNDDFMRMTDFL